jgi:hypothetical protein
VDCPYSVHVFISTKSPGSFAGGLFVERIAASTGLRLCNRPERVYLLGTKSGFPDCAARIERVTQNDTVISCRGEKSEQFPNQKWVYDIRAKSLVRQFSYQPFAMYRIFPKEAGTVFVGSDRQRLIAVEYNQAGRLPFKF